MVDPVLKREQDGRTKTKIRVLDDRARTHEVARMVSGAKVTETSLQHAAQMIAASRQLSPHLLENTNSFPSGSLNFAIVPQVSFLGSTASSTPRDLSSLAVAKTSSHQKVTG